MRTAHQANCDPKETIDRTTYQDRSQNGLAKTGYSCGDGSFRQRLLGSGFRPCVGGISCRGGGAGYHGRRRRPHDASGPELQLQLRPELSPQQHPELVPHRISQGAADTENFVQTKGANPATLEQSTRSSSWFYLDIVCGKKDGPLHARSCQILQMTFLWVK